MPAQHVQQKHCTSGIIERSGICDAGDVREKYNALDALASSKNSYSFGNEYAANGDYENAIMQYGQVSSEDTNYDAAQIAKADAAGKFKETVLAETAANVAASDYESALRTLQCPFFVPKIRCRQEEHNA